MAGYDIGVSVAQSSAAQAGDISGGDFIVGGSGGTNKIPAMVWVILAIGGVLLAFKFLFTSRRR